MNAQAVLVEEKQKRDEKDDLAKKHETREEKRRGMEKRAPETKEAHRVKGKTCPSFKLAAEIKTMTDIKKVNSLLPYFKRSDGYNKERIS